MSTKVNYSNAEKAFIKAAEASFIENLLELATLASADENQLNQIVIKKEMDSLIKGLQFELKKIKKNHIEFYHKLHITEEEEKALFSLEHSSESLSILKSFQARLKELRKEFKTEDKTAELIQEQIAQERKKTSNKKINSRDKWMPL